MQNLMQKIECQKLNAKIECKKLNALSGVRVWGKGDVSNLDAMNVVFSKLRQSVFLEYCMFDFYFHPLLRRNTYPFKLKQHLKCI